MNRKNRGRRKLRTGVVTSDSMDKTIVVTITRTYQHPFYKKVLRKTTRILAHDEQNTCRLGDLVQVVETRPISRGKRWKVRQIVSNIGDNSD